MGGKEFFEGAQVLGFRAATDGFDCMAKGETTFAVTGNERSPILSNEVPPNISSERISAHAEEDADGILRADVRGHREAANIFEDFFILEISQISADTIFFFVQSFLFIHSKHRFIIFSAAPSRDD